MDYTSKLYELSELDDGWDGRGSRAPSRQAIETAKYMTVCPGGDGSLQVEMHAGEADIEIEIAPDGKVKSVLWARST